MGGCCPYRAGASHPTLQWCDNVVTTSSEFSIHVQKFSFKDISASPQKSWEFFLIQPIQVFFYTSSFPPVWVITSHPSWLVLWVGQIFTNFSIGELDESHFCNLGSKISHFHHICAMHLCSNIFPSTNIPVTCNLDSPPLSEELCPSRTREFAP